MNKSLFLSHTLSFTKNFKHQICLCKKKSGVCQFVMFCIKSIFKKSHPMPAFCFFECQLKKRKAYPKRFEKGSGGAGGGGKNFPQKFLLPPPPNIVWTIPHRMLVPNIVCKYYLTFLSDDMKGIIFPDSCRGR